ncbi:MAG: hypothetical protein H7Y37_19645 [Anaerolineae bacterium]|nr:hypothetical protein [Gloeobacterales cyanobacterium ES-bin-313]
MANCIRGQGQAPPPKTPAPWGTEACPPHPLGNFSGLILGVAGLRRFRLTLRAGAQSPKSVDWWHGRYDAARPRLMALPRGEAELEGDHREMSG